MAKTGVMWLSSFVLVSTLAEALSTNCAQPIVYLKQNVLGENCTGENNIGAWKEKNRPALFIFWKKKRASSINST